MRPRPKPGVAVPVAPCPRAELSSGAIEGNVDEHLQVSHPAPVWLSLEHAVILDHCIEVLDTTTDELEPFIPGLLLGGKDSPGGRLCWCEEAWCRCEVPVTNV